MNCKLNIFHSNNQKFLIQLFTKSWWGFGGNAPDLPYPSLQMGDFKGADPLNLLKIFGQAFYKKLVGFGAKPLILHTITMNVCTLTFRRTL